MLSHIFGVKRSSSYDLILQQEIWSQWVEMNSWQHERNFPFQLKMKWIQKLVYSQILYERFIIFKLLFLPDSLIIHDDVMFETLNYLAQSLKWILSSKFIDINPQLKFGIQNTFIRNSNCSWKVYFWGVKKVRLLTLF